jgi:hypothetical protein
MIVKKKKSTWNWWNSFKNTIEHICLKCDFDLENLSVTKNIHFYVIQNMDAW